MEKGSLAPVIERLDRFVRQRMAEKNLPGVVLALTDRERTLHVGTWGYADIAAQTPVTSATLFETGSIGKSFTALALLQLKDEGRVDLHAPVTEYLPWFHVQTRFAPITIHHLLTHTAGIIGGTDFAPDPRFEVWALRDTFTSHPPGEHFRYSNVGYKALGLVLEQLEGKPYAEIIRERVLEPLGLDNTHAAITHSLRPQMAVGYTRLYDDRPAHSSDPVVPATWLQTNTADGCLASPVTDLAAYLRLYLNCGDTAGHRVLTRENFDLMTQPVIERAGAAKPTWYGYGIATTESNGHRVIGHSGGMVGYYSDMRGDLDAGLGAVAMINGIGYPSEFVDFAIQLLQAWAAGEDLPEVPSPHDPTHVSNAADYAGNYQSDDGEIDVVDHGDRLVLRSGDVEVTLETRGEDTFFILHPELRRYLLRFGRDEQGNVVEAFHGNTWYRNERYSGPETFDYPAKWNAFVGEYRSHNPWETHVRILLRKGQLVFEDTGEPLQPHEDDTFSRGDDPGLLRFDTIVNGEALRLTLSSNTYYRFFESA